jgi:hypothetical protein
MVIRFMLWKKHESTEGFGNFRPKLTREQFDLFKDLYSLLVQGSALQMAIVAPVAHRLIFSAYTLNMNARNKVDSALEQSLVFTTLTPVKGWYISALSTTQIFAHIQRTGFSALFHTAWHGGIDVDFVLENDMATEEHDDGGDGDGDGEDETVDDLAREAEEVEDGLELHNFKRPNAVKRTAHREWSFDEFDTAGEAAVEPQSEDKDLGIEILEGRQGEDALLKYDAIISIFDDLCSHWPLRCLYDFRKWTTPKPSVRGTLMSRVVDQWVSLQPIAKQSTAKGGCTWSPDGQTFSLTWGHIRGRNIDLGILRQRVVEQADQLRQTLVDLVPCVDLSQFQLSRVTDDAESPQSLFDRQDNKELFQPHIDRVWAYLGRPQPPGADHNSSPKYDTPIFNRSGKIQQKAAKHWLESSAELLRLILRHFCRTCGITPRAWQTADLLYRSVGVFMRNFRLLRHDTPFIGNPKAKQHDRLMYEAFWALPPHLGIILIFYLGVIRPIEIEIMKNLGIPTVDHEHYIFVHNHKRPTLSSYVFSPSTVNEVLHCGTPELSYESRACRKVMGSIYDHHLCHLHQDSWESLLRSSGHGQAQHTENTNDGHYAQDEISRATGMPLSKRNQQMGVSKAFHSFFGFLPGSLGWGSCANYRPKEEHEQYITIALGVARRLIVEEYGVANGTPSQRIQRVSELISSKPFLLGVEVCLHCFHTSMISPTLVR